MAKKFRYKHILSAVEDKQPSVLFDGEIAVNKFAGKEKLFIKNSNNQMTAFISETQVDNKINNSTSGKTDASAFTAHTGDTSIHHTHSNKSALDAITGNVGTMAYQAASSYSSATQVNTALAGKSNTGHTHAIGDITNLQTTLNGKASTATTLAGYGITNAYTKSETSGATEISNALSGKVNTSDIVSAITPSNSGSTAPIATKVVAENELAVSSALNDLRSTTYTKTEIDDMIGDIESILATI